MPRCRVVQSRANTARLGYSTDTISPAIKTTRELLRQQAITITPGTAPLRTLTSFYDHATAAGITIPAPPAKATPARST